MYIYDILGGRKAPFISGRMSVYLNDGLDRMLCRLEARCRWMDRPRFTLTFKRHVITALHTIFSPGEI